MVSIKAVRFSTIHYHTVFWNLMISWVSTARTSKVRTIAKQEIGIYKHGVAFSSVVFLPSFLQIRLLFKKVFESGHAGTIARDYRIP
jgi:hypothetical protein